MQHIKKIMMISTDGGKSNSTFTHDLRKDKTLNTVGIKGHFHKRIGDIYKNLQLTLHLMMKTEYFPPKRNKVRMITYHSYSKLY